MSTEKNRRGKYDYWNIHNFMCSFNRSPMLFFPSINMTMSYWIEDFFVCVWRKPFWLTNNRSFVNKNSANFLNRLPWSKNIQNSHTLIFVRIKSNCILNDLIFGSLELNKNFKIYTRFHLFFWLMISHILWARFAHGFD